MGGPTSTFSRAAVKVSGLLVVLASLVAGAAVVGSGSAGADTAPPTCGGEVRYRPDGTQRTCTFADEFDGTAVNSAVWTVLESKNVNFGPKEGCFVNSPDNVSVAGGVLNLTALKLAQPMTCAIPGGSKQVSYTEGEVTTYLKWSQLYGLYEIRAKFPVNPTVGTQAALWLWPNNATKYGAWPRSGEIDIAEVYSKYNDRAIPYIHYNAANQSTVTNNYCTLDVTQWHTYTLEWTPTQINISFDGKACVKHLVKDRLLRPPAPFDQPFMLTLTQALGVGTNAVNQTQPMTPKTTQIDWVRVWNG